MSIGQNSLLLFTNVGKQRGNEDVGALANLVAKIISRHAPAVFAKGLVPRHNVKFVAINQCAVDVEERRLKRSENVTTALSGTGHRPGTANRLVHNANAEISLRVMYDVTRTETHCLMQQE
jgi:hypothetical protein